MSYADDLRPTSCREPIRGTNQVPNRGGGYGYQISDMERLERFLILGHEKGTYYAGQRELTLESVDCIDRLLAAGKGNEVVEKIVDVSTRGRAPKNDPAIFALAYMASKTDTTAPCYALPKVTAVCRTPTHLFDFLNICKKLGRGWGSAFKRSIGEYYDRSPLALARLVTKYPQRNGWSHRDVLRKCHFSTQDEDLNQVLEYVTQRERWMRKARVITPATRYMGAVIEVQDERCSDKRRCELIREFALPREVVPTTSLNNVAIWDALLDNMPLHAMLRNLGKMSSIGLLSPMGAGCRRVIDALGDTEQLRRQRVHPVNILVAMKMYSGGRGLRGSLSWRADQQVKAALDDAFYAAFDSIEPTGARHLLGVDVSGSMSFSNCVGCEFITPREAAAAMAMVAVRTEQNTFIHGFSDTFVDLGITRNDSLETVMRKTSDLPFRSTRAATPIEFAMENNIPVDIFCVYTDNETNAGQHPSIRLKEYRQQTGINAKLAVFGMTNTQISIADPNDPGMLDFVGFDTAAPALLADFIKG